MSADIKHVDGIEVIATEPATGPHPHPDFEGQIVLYTGITRLLLADETERFACDECGKSFEAIRSTVAHMGSHSKKRNAEAAQPLAPMYPMETIKAVLRAVLANAGRGQYEKAAAHLNKIGVPRLNNEPWNSGNIEQLYRRYKDSVSVRTPSATSKSDEQRKATLSRRIVEQRRDMEQESEPEPESARPGTVQLRNLIDKQSQALEQLDETLQLAQQQYEEVRATAEAIVMQAETLPIVDEETIEKARKYDAMRAMLKD